MATELLVGVHDLLRRRGSRHAVSATIDLGGLSISTAAVPDDTKVTVEVTLDSINDGVVLGAELDVPWTGECRRCLGPANGVAHVEVHEIYRVDPLEDMLPIIDEAIDVAAAITDSAVLSLPIAPLCSPDCVGPAPEQFPVGTGDSEKVTKDPRWSALDSLRFDSDRDTD